MKTLYTLELDLQCRNLIWNNKKCVIKKVRLEIEKSKYKKKVIPSQEMTTSGVGNNSNIM